MEALTCQTTTGGTNRAWPACVATSERRRHGTWPGSWFSGPRVQLQGFVRLCCLWSLKGFSTKTHQMELQTNLQNETKPNIKAGKITKKSLCFSGCRGWYGEVDLQTQMFCMFQIRFSRPARLDLQHQQGSLVCDGRAPQIDASWNPGVGGQEKREVSWISQDFFPRSGFRRPKSPTDPTGFVSKPPEAAFKRVFKLLTGFERKSWKQAPRDPMQTWIDRSIDH